MAVIKLKEEEMDAIIRKIRSFVRHADVEEQRLIYWSLLKEIVGKDWDGLEWMYDALRQFIDEEFEESNG